MTDRAAIAAIIDQYIKHGWKLRRVLLSRDLAEKLGEAAGLFGDAESRTSPHDGLWFTRRSQPDREAWELRRISASPFAVVEVIPDVLSDDEREELLSDAEERMFESARRREMSH